MNSVFKKALLGISSLAFTFSVLGCSGESDGITLPSSSNNKGGNSTLSQEYYELAYNYMLLDVFYYNAHLKKELNEDFEVYYGVSNEEDFTKGACTKTFGDICNMYNQMSDKHTRYWDPNYAQYIISVLSSTDEVIGLGIEVEQVKDEDDTYLVVSDVYANGPSDGLLSVGDTILSVDGESPKTVEGFEKLTTYDSNSTVIISVRNDGVESTVKIKASAYYSPSVHLSYEDSIPVIKIDKFIGQSVSDSGTYGEFLNIMGKVLDKGASSVIIDLRNNPGGSTDHCTNISSEFLTKGDTIITDIETKVDSVLRKGEMKYIQKFDTLVYTATTDGIAKDLYVVFLADTGSASCSEMMLSAMTVNKKFPVVGLNTYGKGIGQYYLMTYLEGIAGITALYSFDKNGDSFHKYGIAPDFKIDDPDEQMAKAIELAREAKYVRTEGYGKVSTGNFNKRAAIPNTRREILLDAGLFKFKNFKK